MHYFQFVKRQIQNIKRLDPSIHGTLEIFYMPGFRAMNTWFIAHKLYPKHPTLARILSLKAQRKTGIDIHPGATIGQDVFIDHGSGVVIGETCIIGDRVMIYQGVTLGATGKVKGKRHPTVENDVVIGAGSKVIGNIVLHEGCKIGAGSVIVKDVPAYTTMIPAPAYPIRNKEGRIPVPNVNELEHKIDNALLELKNEHEILNRLH